MFLRTGEALRSPETAQKPSTGTWRETEEDKRVWRPHRQTQGRMKESYLTKQCSRIGTLLNWCHIIYKRGLFAYPTLLAVSQTERGFNKLLWLIHLSTFLKIFSLILYPQLSWLLSFKYATYFVFCFYMFCRIFLYNKQMFVYILYRRNNPQARELQTKILWLYDLTSHLLQQCLQ